QELILERSSLNLGDIVETSLKNNDTFRKKDVGFRTDIQRDPLYVLCDEALLCRVLNNLIHNACRVTDCGYIEVICTCDVRSNRAIVCIRDTGPGIPADQRDKIFNKFIRLKSADQLYSSKGLGLTFCKMVIEAHDGNIHATENPEGGTDMVFDLPLAHLPN
ncbi:HAMP domain-containing histidine kinase, partial [bacterium]|nr:HAMP domain-containing histidine kinase [candidate division CSSED10-310 bacterium]